MEKSKEISIVYEEKIRRNSFPWNSKSDEGDFVWVQVPSSALNGAKPNPVYFFKKVFAVVVNFTRK